MQCRNASRFGPYWTIYEPNPALITTRGAVSGLPDCGLTIRGGTKSKSKLKYEVLIQRVLTA